uniref:Putative secreted protein n=1 Tax=Psorophora albipes TaxID=869069 RepID=T1DJ83_9DIPT
MIILTIFLFPTQTKMISANPMILKICLPAHNTHSSAAYANGFVFFYLGMCTFDTARGSITKIMASSFVVFGFSFQKDFFPSRNGNTSFWFHAS